MDDKRFDEWPLFFAEDGNCKVQARENFDCGLLLTLIALKSRGMMKDRVFSITQTVYHGPYYMRYIISPARATLVDNDVVKAEASYVVFLTKPGGISEVYNVGRYIDELKKKATPVSSGVAFACTKAS